MTPRVSARMRWRTIAATGRGAVREARAAARRPSRSPRGSARGRPRGDELAQLGHRPVRLGRAQDLVGQGEQQGPAAGVGEQAAEAVGAAALGACRPGDGGAQQALGQLGGGGDPVGVTGARVGHHTH